MAEQKKKTKEQRKARRKTMEPSPLKKKVAELETNKLALEVRIADLEACLSPIVGQSLRFATALEGEHDKRTAAINIRLLDLKKMRTVLANNGTRPKKDYPDFQDIAVETIRSVGDELLNAGPLAFELGLAYEAGYEHRRSEELARTQRRKAR